MSGKHTPGPWTIGYHFGSDVTAQLGYSVGPALVMLPSAPSIQGAREAAANADLISAAPEMLNALEACVASLERADTSEGVCCCGDSMDAHPDPMNCGHSPVDMGEYYAGKAIDAARAVIAKVRGVDFAPRHNDVGQNDG